MILSVNILGQVFKTIKKNRNLNVKNDISHGNFQNALFKFIAKPEHCHVAQRKQVAHLLK